jgi:hypothetical protein
MPRQERPRELCLADLGGRGAARKIDVPARAHEMSDARREPFALLGGEPDIKDAEGGIRAQLLNRRNGVARAAGSRPDRRR